MNRVAIDVDEVLVNFLFPMANHNYKLHKLRSKPKYNYVYREIFEIDEPSSKKMVQEFYQSEQPAKALSHLGKFRILCAYNDGAFGVMHWNLLAEHAMDASVERPRPVVVGVNDYSVGLFNGDDGVVLGNRAFFASDEGVRELACSRLPQHQNGYATSIHRSQGSEFDKVLIVLPYAESKLLNRELLYVAVSRAKEKVFLVGSEESFAAAVMRSEKQNSGVWDLINHSTTITA